MNAVGLLLSIVVGLGIVALAGVAIANTYVLIRGSRAMAAAARHHSVVDDDAAMASQLTPALSLVVPWCGADPVERLATMRSLRYPDLQIIVVSTGAEATAELSDALGLIDVPMVLPADLPSRVEVARALIPQDGTSLLVVEAVGPADETDLVNVGVGLARARGVVVLRKGMVLADDTLLRLARPFRDRPRATLATTSAARPLAAAILDQQRVVGWRWPPSWSGRVELVRRLRTAVLPHAAGVGPAGGLVLLRRDHVQEVGGFKPGTAATDDDLLHRVARMQVATARPPRVVEPVPAPICWRDGDAGDEPAAADHHLGGAGATWFRPVLLAAGLAGLAGLLVGEIDPGLVALLAVVGIAVPATLSLAALAAEDFAFPRRGGPGELGAAIVAALVEPFTPSRR